MCVGVNWHVACKSSGRAHKFHAALPTNEMLPLRLLPTNGTNETLSVCHSVSMLAEQPPILRILLIVRVNLIKLINFRCAVRKPQVKQLTAVGHCPSLILSYDLCHNLAYGICRIMPSSQKLLSFKRKWLPKQSFESATTNMEIIIHCPYLDAAVCLTRLVLTLVYKTQS